MQDASGFAEGRALVLWDGKTGMIDEAGAFRELAADFSTERAFSEGFCVVAQSGRYGLIDCAGNTVLPAEFEELSDVREGLAAGVRAGVRGLYDLAGALLVPWEGSITPPSDGLVAVNTDSYPYTNQGGYFRSPFPARGPRESGTTR